MLVALHAAEDPAARHLFHPGFASALEASIGSATCATAAACALEDVCFALHGCLYPPTTVPVATCALSSVIEHSYCFSAAADAIVAAVADDPAAPAAEANKATQNVIEIRTPLGIEKLRVPRSARELATSPQAEQWMEADRKAMNVILAIAGNRLVRLSDARASGVPIYDCVTQRRVKINQSTGELDAASGFKSRHCVNGSPRNPTAAKVRATSTRPFFAASSDALTENLFLADVAQRDRECEQGDVSSAYTHGDRSRYGSPDAARKPVLRIPRHLAVYSDAGDEMGIELGSPLWGEPPAGAAWEFEFDKELTQAGWRAAEGVPCLYVFTGARSDAALITKVDDFLISETRGCFDIINATFDVLNRRFDLTRIHNPVSFNGMRLARDRSRRALTVSMPQKVREALQELAPDMRTRAAAPLPAAQDDMRNIADSLRAAPLPAGGKLTPEAKFVQKATGYFRYVTRVHPGILLPVHRLSCVMTSPPPEAAKVVYGVLRWLLTNAHAGITYGGGGLSSAPTLTGSLYANIDLTKPAPAELACVADSTYGTFDLYAFALTYYGGAVLANVRRVGLEVSSSMQSEAVATCRAAEHVESAREVLRALGVPSAGPTFVGTDNKANMLVANNVGSSTRSRHFLRMYVVLQQRIARESIAVGHVPDRENPSDYLTKWVDKKKFNLSNDYLTNRRAFVP